MTKVFGMISSSLVYCSIAKPSSHKHLLQLEVAHSPRYNCRHSLYPKNETALKTIVMMANCSFSAQTPTGSQKEKSQSKYYNSRVRIKASSSHLQNKILNILLEDEVRGALSKLTPASIISCHCLSAINQRLPCSLSKTISLDRASWTHLKPSPCYTNLSSFEGSKGNLPNTFAQYYLSYKSTSIPLEAVKKCTRQRPRRLSLDSVLLYRYGWDKPPMTSQSLSTGSPKVYQPKYNKTVAQSSQSVRGLSPRLILHDSGMISTFKMDICFSKMSYKRFILCETLQLNRAIAGNETIATIEGQHKLMEAFLALNYKRKTSRNDPLTSEHGDSLRCSLHKRYISVKRRGDQSRTVLFMRNASCIPQNCHNGIDEDVKAS